MNGDHGIVGIPEWSASQSDKLFFFSFFCEPIRERPKEKSSIPILALNTERVASFLVCEKAAIL